MSPTARPYTEKQAETIERVRGELLAGRTFALRGASSRSVRGYFPPMHRDQWGHMIATLGRMAGQSDALAQLAHSCLRINLYGTAAEATAQMYEQAAAAVAAGYEDVIRKASPEPGRPSSWHRPYTLAELVLASYYLAEAASKDYTGGVPTVGWCIPEIARDARVYPHAVSFPALKLEARA